jgi:UDP-glucose 4-epimerase
LTRHFSSSPFVPVAAGHDSRIQLVHESDVVALLEHLVLHDLAGTVNVAGDGAMTVIQAIHRAGRLPLQIPLPALDGVGRGLALLRIGRFSAPQVRSLTQGRVMDTTLLRERFGFVPTFTTVAAFDDFISRLNPVVESRMIRAAEQRIASTFGFRADDERPWRARVPRDVGTETVNGTTDSTEPQSGAGGTTPPSTSSSPEDAAGVTEQLPPAPRRLFSINGDAVRSSPRTPRPGGRKQ